jgi:hypothetical protein
MVSMYVFFYSQMSWNISTPSTKRKENSLSKSSTIEDSFTREKSKRLTQSEKNFSPFTKGLVQLPTFTISWTLFITAKKIVNLISSNMFIKTNDHFPFLFFYFSPFNICILSYSSRILISFLINLSSLS